LFKIFRILGTPNDELWPGVDQLPDYKDNFPSWGTKDLESIFPDLEVAGCELLGVSVLNLNDFNNDSSICRKCSLTLQQPAYLQREL
jgi:hypothetical protein